MKKGIIGRKIGHDADFRRKRQCHPGYGHRMPDPARVVQKKTAADRRL